ncbi:hypothetical protein KKHLCK_09780 [Candidatus Electrothrix laxa]
MTPAIQTGIPSLRHTSPILEKNGVSYRATEQISNQSGIPLRDAPTAG